MITPIANDCISDICEYNMSEIPKHLSTGSNIALKLLSTFNVRIKISHHVTSALYSPYSSYTTDSLIKISMRNAVQLMITNKMRRLVNKNL